MLARHVRRAGGAWWKPVTCPLLRQVRVGVSGDVAVLPDPRALVALIETELAALAGAGAGAGGPAAADGLAVSVAVA